MANLLTLGILIFLGVAAHFWNFFPGSAAGYELWRLPTDTLAYTTVAFTVVPGIPVLWEGRRFLGAPVPRPAIQKEEREP